MSGFEDRYVSVGGIKTRYWQAGSKGSPIVLLHGIGCSVLDWDQNIASLATSHRIYALDMLGSGLTKKPSGESYTVPRLGRAESAPERVASMVLVAPNATNLAILSGPLGA
jgi:pimeloyl-ACP methyl ester carboxylesterase